MSRTNGANISIREHSQGEGTAESGTDLALPSLDRDYHRCEARLSLLRRSRNRWRPLAPRMSRGRKGHAKRLGLPLEAVA